MENHICVACKKKFKTYEDYLNHVCEKTGHKPNTAEHLDATSNGQFSRQSTKALERGEAKKAKKVK